MSSRATMFGWKIHPGLGVLIALLLGISVSAEEQFGKQRRAMVDEVARMAQSFGAGMGRDILSPRVLSALERIPRHEFVPIWHRADAYDNRPLPIGHGQTISQPYIVAVMSNLLAIEPGQAVLEIGTGSGYQAVVLAELGARVSSMEIVEPLAREAVVRLQRLGHDGIAVKVGDGYQGWPEHAPFDAIIVTAAASHIPLPLMQQLKTGGRMVIPIGPAFQTQQLVLVEKQANGKAMTRQLMPVVFVPLTGGHD